jgi:hypothetical protein
MNDQQKRLFELAEEIESKKKEMRKLNEELEVVLRELGEDTYHQDPVTQSVYKVVRPTGTFIEYKTIGYERTAKAGESRGTLSKSEAKEQGFIV